MDTTDCPPGMHRTSKRYNCGTLQYFYHLPSEEPSEKRTFRSKKNAWQYYLDKTVTPAVEVTAPAVEVTAPAVEAATVAPAIVEATVVPAVFHGPALTDDDLQSVARKYNVDVSVARLYHELRGKYPGYMAHFFDLNYKRDFHPCNDIRCCGLEHDDSDIDSVCDDDTVN